MIIILGFFKMISKILKFLDFKLIYILYHYTYAKY